MSLNTLLGMILVVLAILVKTPPFSHACSQNVIFDSESELKFNKDIERYVLETTIAFSIGVDEDVCFSVSDPDNPIGKAVFRFSFNDVVSMYNYKNMYEFAMATPDVHCLCDCPGGADHCNPDQNTCWKTGVSSSANCFTYYSSSQPSKSCGIGSILGSAEVCCAVKVKALSDDLYKAFEINAPYTTGTFTIKSDENPPAKQFPISLDDSGSFFYDSPHGIFQVSFESPGKVAPVPPGWYFGHSQSSNVLSNVEVNGLTEWNLYKLGWYKKHGQSGKFKVDETQVKFSFRGEAVDCNTNDINVRFASKFIQQDALKEAKPLKEFFKSTVAKAVRNDEHRKVEIYYDNFVRINVRITIEGEKRILQQFNKPHFEGFHAGITLDEHSNRFVNISIVMGNGTLYGIMRREGKEVAYFDIISPSSLQSNYSKLIQITEWCKHESLEAEICIHNGNYDSKTCQSVKCKIKPMIQFSVPDATINYTIIENDDIFTPSTWSKYLNPAEWFNGIGGWQEGVIMGVALVGFFVILGVLAKICKTLNCCFKICQCMSKLVACYGRQGKKKKFTPRASYTSIKTDTKGGYI